MKRTPNNPPNSQSTKEMTVQPQQTNERYRQLRDKLEKLGYLDTLSPDSMQLADSLLADLVHTTDTCRTLKQDLDVCSQHRRFLEAKLEPLRHDVSQLTRENNQLHLSVIQAADLRDEREKRTQIAMRKYQNDISDLQFLNRQLEAKAQSEKHRAEAERMRLEHILTLIGSQVGREIDAQYVKNNAEKLTAKWLASQNASTIDVDTGLEPMPADFVPKVPRTDPHIVDLLSLSETKIKHLETECQTLNSKNDDMQIEIALLKDQVTVREQEMARLGSLLESERAHVGIRVKNDGQYVDASVDYAKKSRVEQLEIQIEFLHETISELENVFNIFEIINNYKAATQHEKEKAMVRAEAKRTANENKQELQRLQKKNQGLCSDLRQLENMVKEFEAAQKSHRSSKIPLSAAKKDPEVSDERVPNETPVPSMAQQGAAVGSKNQKDSINKEIRQLRQDFLTVSRDLKITKTHLDHILQEHPSIDANIPSSSKKVDENPLVERIVKENNDFYVKVTQLEETIHRLETDNRALESFKKEHNDLSPDLARAKSLIATLEKQAAHLQLDIDRILQRCNEIEKSKNEISAQRKSLTEELQDTKAKLEKIGGTVTKLTNENDTLRRDFKNAASGKTGIATHAEAVEEDRTPNLADKSTQVDSLKESTDIKELRESLDLRQRDIADMERVRDTLEFELANATSTISHMESELNSLKSATNSVPAPSQNSRDLLREFDRERDQFQHDLDLKTERIAELEDQILSFSGDVSVKSAHIKQLDAELQQTRQTLRQETDSLSQLRSQLEHLNRDNQHLRQEASRATDQAQHLSADVSSVLKENAQLTDELAEMASQHDAVVHELEEQSQKATYFEQLSETKEQENEQIMDIFRKAVSEHTQLGEQVKVLTEREQEYRNEISVFETRIETLTVEKNHFADEVEQLRHELNSSDTKRLNVGGTANRLESELSNQTANSNALQNEVKTTRGLLTQLQRDNEQLHEKLLKCTADLERSKGDMIQKQAHVESLKQSLSSECGKVAKYETMIGEERTKAVRSDISRSKTEAERDLLHEQLVSTASHDQTYAQKVATLTAELARQEARNSANQEHIRELEANMVALSDNLHQTDRDRIYLQEKLDRPNGKSRRTSAPPAIFATPATKYSNVVDLSPLAAPSEVEMNITQQLEKSKKELDRYGAMFRRSPSEACPEKSSRDPSPRREADILEHRENNNTTMHLHAFTATGEESGDEYIDAKRFLSLWKAQNEAMRLEIESQNPSTQDLPALRSAPPLGLLHRPTTAMFEMTERERKDLERENQLLMDVISQARRDLRAADTPNAWSP